MDRGGARAELAVEGLLLPLDRARASLNRMLLAGAPSLARKETRIAWRALLGIGVALALSLTAPMLLFAVAPILLGVPHLAADLRYLVLRPRYSRNARALLILGCLPFLLLRLAPTFTLRGAGTAQLEMLSAGVALLACALLAGLGAGARGRLAIVVPIIVSLSVLAFRHAEGARIAFAHLHNLVAIAVWLIVFRSREHGRRALLLPLAALGIGLCAVFLYGAIVPSAELTRPGPGGVQLIRVAAWLAPGLSLRLGVGLVVSYVFLQSVHYSVWLGIIPEEAVRGDAGHSFRMSFRAMVRDFGGWGLLVVVLGSLLVIALAGRDLERTREAYLSLSAFHGYLELAVLTLALCGGRALVATAR